MERGRGSRRRGRQAGRRCKTRSFLGDVNAVSAINFPSGREFQKFPIQKTPRGEARRGRRRGHELCMKASIRGLSERNPWFQCLFFESLKAENLGKAVALSAERSSKRFGPSCEGNGWNLRMESRNNFTIFLIPIFPFLSQSPKSFLFSKKLSFQIRKFQPTLNFPSLSPTFHKFSNFPNSNLRSIPL